MATIRFFCVICGTALKGTTETLGDVVECDACRRHVPVPKIRDMAVSGTGCAPALPPEVLSLEVKFLCASCRSPLRTDARGEGCSVVCPVCGEGTAIPRWSNASRWPRHDEPARTMPGAATLSAEEIEFLSKPAPEAAGAMP